MPLATGSVSVDNAGNVSGTGLARDLYDAEGLDWNNIPAELVPMACKAHQQAVRPEETGPARENSTAGKRYHSKHLQTFVMRAPFRTGNAGYPRRMTKQFHGVSVRTDGEGLDERIDRVVAELAKRSAGIAPKKNTVARQAMVRGLEVIERELGLATK